MRNGAPPAIGRPSTGFTIAELGFLGVHLPEEYGGGGAGMSELAIVCEELAAVGCPLLLILVSPAICAELIQHFGTAEQKDRWLRPMVTGTKMVFARSLGKGFMSDNYVHVMDITPLGIGPAKKPTTN